MTWGPRSGQSFTWRGRRRVATAPGLAMSAPADGSRYRTLAVSLTFHARLKAMAYRRGMPMALIADRAIRRAIDVARDESFLGCRRRRVA